MGLLGDNCTPDCVYSRWVIPLACQWEWHIFLAISTFPLDVRCFFFFLIRTQNVTQRISTEVRNRVFCESYIGKEYRISCMLSHISIYVCIYMFTYYMHKWTPWSYTQTYPQMTHCFLLDSFVTNTKSFLS